MTRHIDPSRLADLVTRVAREVDEGIVPSCQFAVGLGGEVVEHRAFGEATTSTRYVLFSATKGFVAGAMYQLFDEGSASPADAVATHIPEFADNAKAEITIEQLMTHTSGFPRAPMPPDLWSDRDARVRRMAAWRLNWEPGTRFEYHPTSAHWVLAEIMARVDGTDHRDVVRRRINDRLGLTRFALGLDPETPDRIAPLTVTGEDPDGDELEAVFGVRSYDRGEVTPEALSEFNGPAALASGMPGGGGVSDAADVARYYQALVHNPDGVWDATNLADHTRAIRCTLPDPLLGHASNRSLGLIVAGDDGRSALRGMGHTVSPRTFGHNGAGGQIAWADPVSGISFCYLTNGIDRNFLREHRRTSGIASRAGLLTTAR